MQAFELQVAMKKRSQFERCVALLVRQYGGARRARGELLLLAALLKLQN
jgi:hypothetical protein